MESRASVHPADETLVSYGLGKLDETVAGTVSQHLEQCAPCRQRVAELSGDSFVGRLRQAQPRQVEAPVRPKTIVETEPHDRARHAEQAAISQVQAASMPSEACTTLPPELINHPQYEVIRELGRGGMGVVYLARNRLMDRLEVLKLLSQEMLGKPERVERFLREIQAAAKLHHPNVVAAYTAFPMGKMLVFGMEYVEGDDLAKLVRARGPLPILNASYFAYQTAQGLQHAHERGMIHRDIKPGNLILFRQGKKGTVKILDFGLAKVTSEQKIDGTLTQQGQMLGTPDYIAPEQTLDAQKADIRSDIYSLGCTLYHLLTGNPPFSGNTLYAVLQAHHAVEAKSVNLVRPEVPVELAAIVAKMMAKEPSRRYQTPAEVAQALKPFLRTGVLASPQPELEPGVSKIDRPSAIPVGGAIPLPDDAEPPLVPMQEVEASERWKSLIDTPSLTPSGARSAIRKPRRHWPIWFWPATIAGALLGGLVIAWAAGVSVKTKDGVIVLQGLPENAEVLVDGEKITVQLPGEGGPAEIRVPPGIRGVQVKKDGFKVFGEEISIARGEKKLLSVRLEALPRKASTKESDEVARIGRTGDKAQLPNIVGTISPHKSPGKNPNPPDPLVAPFDEVAAKEAQEEWAGHVGSPFVITNKIGMQMTLIPPGRFEMGSKDSSDQLRRLFPVEAASIRWPKEILDWWHIQPYGEGPVHAVTITRPFFLGKYEVTKREFKQFVDERSYRTEAERDGKGIGCVLNGDNKFVVQIGPDCTWRDWGSEQPDDAPVVIVSYNDATDFCAWLSGKEGKTYRLPTEAEWEYACRAGTVSRYYNGDDPQELTKIGNVRDATWMGHFSENPLQQAATDSSDGYTVASPVGKFQPNHFGLYDMLGNAWEWCADGWDETYYRNSPARDPAGPPAGSFGLRVLRGGSWFDGGLQCRAAKRWPSPPNAHAAGVGFRVALSVADGMGDAVVKPARQDKESVSDPRKITHFIRGDWRVENGDLVQSSLAEGFDANPTLLFGDTKWSDYDLTLEFKKTGGYDSVGFFFHWSNPGQYRMFNLAAYGNSGKELAYFYDGQWGREGANYKEDTLLSDRWYAVKIEARSGSYRCYLDGALQFAQTDERFSHGLFGLRTWGTTARFRNIRVTAPDGKALWNGLPEPIKGPISAPSSPLK